MSVTVFMDEGPFTYLTIVQQSSGMPVVTGVTAEDYLSFAKADITAGTKHGLINALGNAKRALHLMVDTLLQNYGLLMHNKRTPFPGKLQLMDNVGLIALNVFRRLNLERNVVEHEYSSPESERVQDFIDVCHLMLLAIERLGQDIPYRSVVGLREAGGHALLVLEPMLGQLEFHELVEPTIDITDAFGADIEYVHSIFRSGKREPNASAVGDVFRTVALGADNKDEWAPILEKLISIRNDMTSTRVTKVHGDVVTIWSSHSFPVDDVQKKRLAKFLGDIAPPELGASGSAHPEDAAASRPSSDDGDDS
jgi:hypothetical protein